MVNAHIKLVASKFYPHDNALLVGQVALDWNQLHLIVYCLFVGFTGMKPHIASAVFYSQRADAGQRDMTRDAALARLAENAGEPNYDAMQVRIRSLFKKIGVAAGQRNAAIHGAILFDEAGNCTPDPFNPPKADTPKLDWHRAPSEYLKTLDEIALEAVDLFNDAASLLEWPPEVLV